MHYVSYNYGAFPPPAFTPSSFKFKEGQKVRVIATKSTYSRWDAHKQSHIGEVGVVKQAGGLSYNYEYLVEFKSGVMFAQTTCRHMFNEQDLESYGDIQNNKTTKENDKMAIKNAKLYVGVKFLGKYADGTIYSFASDTDLAVGDVVVVDTAYGFGVGTVMNLNAAADKATKWIVQKVDTTAHTARLEKQVKLAGIREEMEKRRKQLEELELLRYLATKDSTMAEMLAQYEELCK